MSHNSYGRYYLDISPEFRAAFYTPLGDSLIQAAGNVEDMVPGGPTQSDNQDGSLQEKTQVGRGEEREEEYWDNLRTRFEVQVHELEETIKETPGTAGISG
ncbi:hypothetical protein C8J57DRAFT_1251195 [Mycena rebaudengoi]|nr:hypothetical protein C8J57DRAFT_1251195 [Mycena rebaudengoi]